METFERRNEIWEVLRIRKYDTVKNLANEFHVSERTIRRDIHIISLKKPIYTLTGKYGGVFVIEGPEKARCLNNKEKELLTKIFIYAKNTPGVFNELELNVLEKLISDSPKK